MKLFLAESNNIRLINRDQLIDMIIKLYPGAIPSANFIANQYPSQENRICSECGAMMIKRK